MITTQVVLVKQLRELEAAGDYANSDVLVSHQECRITYCLHNFLRSQKLYLHVSEKLITCIREWGNPPLDEWCVHGRRFYMANSAD